MQVSEKAVDHERFALFNKHCTSHQKPRMFAEKLCQLVKGISEGVPIKTLSFLVDACQLLADCHKVIGLGGWWLGLGLGLGQGAIAPSTWDPQPESGLRPRSAGGLSYPDHDLDRLHLHGADSRTGSRKVVLCKRGLGEGGGEGGREGGREGDYCVLM